MNGGRPRHSSSRCRRHPKGLATYCLVRYADDFVVMVAGTREHAEALRAEVAEVHFPMGLRLSEEKTTIAHIDEGFDFLNFRIQRQVKPGSNKRFVYTWPSRKSLSSIMAKVKAITKQGTNQSLADLLRHLNMALRGWTTYFRHGVSTRTFHYLLARRAPPVYPSGRGSAEPVYWAGVGRCAGRVCLSMDRGTAGCNHSKHHQRRDSLDLFSISAFHHSSQRKLSRSCMF